MIEEPLAVGWGDLSLAGSLYLPASQPPHPVVVMIQGSGPSDRTSNGYFPPIRDAFLARGIGTYAFDKPGCGDSSGDWRDHGLKDRAEQVVAVLDSLRQHPLVEAANLGVWGHSQGGWLVQMLAARFPDLPFAITSAGPSIDLPSQDLYGCEHTMRDSGHSRSDIDLALAFLAEVHAAARQNLPFETVESRILKPARGRSWNPYTAKADEADWRPTAKFLTEAYEPVETLQRIRCPFLAVYGGRDLLLPPWQSAGDTGRALQVAGNQDSAVVVFPEGDHRIQHQGTFVNGYLDLLANWTATHIT